MAKQRIRLRGTRTQSKVAQKILANFNKEIKVFKYLNIE